MKKIRKGDMVVLITGRDKGRKGAVIEVLADDRVRVEGLNMSKKHHRARGAFACVQRTDLQSGDAERRPRRVQGARERAQGPRVQVEQRNGRRQMSATR